MDNEPSLPDDSTKELIATLETDTIRASREKTQELLRMLREASAALKTDLLLDENDRSDQPGD